MYPRFVRSAPLASPSPSPSPSPKTSSIISSAVRACVRAHLQHSCIHAFMHRPRPDQTGQAQTSQAKGRSRSAEPVTHASRNVSVTPSPPPSGSAHGRATRTSKCRCLGGRPRTSEHKAPARARAAAVFLEAAHSAQPAAPHREPRCTDGRDGRDGRDGTDDIDIMIVIGQQPAIRGPTRTHTHTHTHPAPAPVPMPMPPAAAAAARVQSSPPRLVLFIYPPPLLSSRDARIAHRPSRLATGDGGPGYGDDSRRASSLQPPAAWVRTRPGRGALPGITDPPTPPPPPPQKKNPRGGARPLRARSARWGLGHSALGRLGSSSCLARPGAATPPATPPATSQLPAPSSQSWCCRQHLRRRPDGTLPALAPRRGGGQAYVVCVCVLCDMYVPVRVRGASTPPGDSGRPSVRASTGVERRPQGHKDTRTHS
ncbi:hypothetical protein BC628DRAFT_915477 [Trametes gibbosa]|nr:hypothetical protein BC628DRAFT_915477 [Trametes gibbosa]